MANAWVIEPLPLAGIDATADVGFDGLNLANDFAGVTWRTSVNGYRRLIIDLGVDRGIDTAMLFGIRNFATNESVNFYYKTAAGAAGAWQASIQGAPLFAGSSSFRDANFGVGLFDLNASIVARYLLIELQSNYDGPIQASRLVIGKRIQLERNFSFGASFGVKDLGSLEFSRRGVLLRNRGAKLRTTALTFSSVRKGEVEQLTKPLLERIGNTECVALVSDPAPNAQRQNRCYFGPLVGDLSQTWRRADAWEAKINMVSIF